MTWTLTSAMQVDNGYTYVSDEMNAPYSRIWTVCNWNNFSVKYPCSYEGLALINARIDNTEKNERLSLRIVILKDMIFSLPNNIETLILG